MPSPPVPGRRLRDLFQPFLAALGACAALATPAVARENPGALAPVQRQLRATAPLARRAMPLGLAPVAELGPADVDARAALAGLRQWNRGGGRPRREGIVRPLGHRRSFSRSGRALLAMTAEEHGRTSAVTPSDDTVLWTVGVRVAHARRVRVRLTDVVLPPGSELYAYGADEDTRGPAPVEDGVAWSPSVDGGTAWIEVHLPKASIVATQRYGFSVDAVLESVAEEDAQAATGPLAADCLVDFACAVNIPSSLAKLRAAIGQLTFVDGSFSYLCTGGLVNDGDPSTFVPYLLTANHCFHTQASATSLEVRWGYESRSCGGGTTSSGTTYGATLLASSAASDFTFVRLKQQPPAGRYFLGWTTATPQGTLTRFHHPNGDVVHVSQHTPSSGGSTCADAPTLDFLYTTVTYGATAGGSSGAPLLNASGQIVGQLLGACGPNPGDSCDPSNRDVDGRFSRTFPLIEQWIDVPPATTTTTIVASTTSTTIRVPCDVEPCDARYPYCGPDGYCWLLPCDTLCGADNCCGGDLPECASNGLCYGDFGCPPRAPFPFDTQCAVCAGQDLPAKIQTLFERAAAKATLGRRRAARKRLKQARRKLAKAWHRGRIDEPCHLAAQRSIDLAIDQER